MPGGGGGYITSSCTNFTKERSFARVIYLILMKDLGR